MLITFIMLWCRRCFLVFSNVYQFCVGEIAPVSCTRKVYREVGSDLATFLHGINPKLSATTYSI